MSALSNAPIKSLPVEGGIKPSHVVNLQRGQTTVMVTGIAAEYILWLEAQLETTNDALTDAVRQGTALEHELDDLRRRAVDCL